jgi:hypothetical protein
MLMMAGIWVRQYRTLHDAVGPTHARPRLHRRPNVYLGPPPPHPPLGVEHLLRDVKDATISTLSSEIGDMVTGLRGLKSKLLEIREYLEAVVEGKLPVNHDIMRNLQVSWSG